MSCFLKAKHAVLGPTFGAICFLKTEEEASSTLAWSHEQNDKEHAEHHANVRHFELSPKDPAPRMRACERMSQSVYDLQFSLREMAICFATWVSVLLGTRTTSCHVVDRDLSLIRGRQPRAVSWDGRQGVRFGKTGEANPRSTSTPSASV